MTRRIAATAALAMALMAPATAQAAESVGMTGSVLTYVSGDGTVDNVWLTESGTVHRLAEATSPSGTIGSGCTYVGSSTAECTGATSASLQVLDGDDTVNAPAALPATIAGGPGTDTINAGPLDDVIDGGTGQDTIDAGDGSDTIEARDGEVDTIDCGPGDDTVHADAVDVLANCAPPPPPDEPEEPGEPDAPVEPAGTADPPPAPVTQEPPPTADPPAPAPQLPGDPGALPPLAVLPVTIEQEVVKVGRDGIATFDLSCAPSEVAGCVGIVYLDPLPRAKKGKPRARAARRGRYGRSRFDVPAGGKARLRMPLSAAARRKLGLTSGRKARAARRGRKVKSQVTVKQRGKKPVKSKVTLKT